MSKSKSRTNKKERKRRVTEKKRGGIGEQYAASKIQSFMRNPKIAERRTSHFLKNICSDSNVCIAFGKETEKIFQFFDNFINMNYIKLPIRRIGEPSANGFVHELEYERDGYVSHTILKSSMKKESDNLVYEYIVGQFLNKVADYYPGIMSTYHLVRYIDNDSYNTMKNNEKITRPEQLHRIRLQYIEFEGSPLDILLEACSRPLNYAILTQHIKDAVRLQELNAGACQQEIILVLFQIYFTLHCLRDRFTHYDLHMKNVLCYAFAKNKYMEFVYYMNDGSVIRYNYHRIAYMIDYGRSYFYESDENNSLKILSDICRLPCPPPPCGVEQGFRNLYGNEKRYITGYKRNISADLRLARLIFDPRFSKKDRSLFYNRIKFDDAFSTKEVIDEAFRTTGKVTNVTDFLHAITSHINKCNIDLTNVYKRIGYTKIGTLHIFEDGVTPMIYEPEPETKLKSPPKKQPAPAKAPVQAPDQTHAPAQTPAPAKAPVQTPAPAQTPKTDIPPTKETPATDATQKISTRVSTAIKSPYYMEFMNQEREKPKPDLPPEFFDAETLKS